jgi:hypothetical protein
LGIWPLESPDSSVWGKRRVGRENRAKEMCKKKVAILSK